MPVAKSAAKCIPVDVWKTLSSELPDLEGRKCYVGLDVASHEDLAALVAFFPFTESEKEEHLSPETLSVLLPDIDDDFDDDDEDDFEEAPPAVVPGWLKVWIFCPATKVQDRLRKNDPFYDQWAKDGHLIATRGKRISFKKIFRKIQEINRLYSIAELAYDRWGAEAIIQNIEDQMPEMMVIDIDQTHKGMNLGVQSFLTLIIEEGLRHEGNPVMEWCCGNAASKERAGAIKLDKEASADKIDPVVAASMAIGRACLGHGEFSESYYDDDGLIGEEMF